MRVWPNAREEEGEKTPSEACTSILADRVSEFGTITHDNEVSSRRERERGGSVWMETPHNMSAARVESASTHRVTNEASG